MSEKFQWDAFLSHSSMDKSRVARLAKRLKDTGLHVWFDQGTIESGNDIVADIEEGLDNSRVLILCMTEAAFKSDWVRTERNTATFRDPLNRERRFLPLLLEDCRIPAQIRRIEYIDWRTESESAWKELLAHLKPGAAPLPAVHEDQWNPFDPYTPALGSGFIGRHEELRRLRQVIETGSGVSVVGDWRMGKTSLLAALADRVRASGRVVLLLSGEGPEGKSVAAFVERVTQRAAPNEAEEAADQLSEWARARIDGGWRPVLIVDAADHVVSQFEHRFFIRLRAMMQEILTVVFCSRRELDRIYQERGLVSPFYNVLSMERVVLLDSKTVDEMVHWGDGILRVEDQSTVREWAGCHPYFVQLIAHELADARLHGRAITRAMDRIYDTSAGRFRELWPVLSEHDRDDLKKAATGVAATRRTLRLRGLVTDDGLPFGRIFSEWLREGQA